MKPLLIIAAGGLARETLSAVHAAGTYDPVAVLDDDPRMIGSSVGGITVTGTLAEAERYRTAAVVVCAGKGLSRAGIVRRLRELGIGAGRFATIVDPSVRIGNGCTVGEGSILLAQTTLTADVVLGSHVVAMPGVTFTHDDIVGDFTTFAAGVSLGGGVEVGRGAYLGMNAGVRERVRVGAFATVGMGSVVLADVPDGETWAGVPAGPIAERSHAVEEVSG